MLYLKMGPSVFLSASPPMIRQPSKVANHSVNVSLYFLNDVGFCWTWDQHISFSQEHYKPWLQRSIAALLFTFFLYKKLFILSFLNPCMWMSEQIIAERKWRTSTLAALCSKMASVGVRAETACFPCGYILHYMSLRSDQGLRAGLTCRFSVQWS